MAILIVLLYATIVLNQTNVIGLGEFFGYLFYVIVAIGIVAAIWLFIKPTKKTNQ